MDQSHPLTHQTVQEYKCEKKKITPACFEIAYSVVVVVLALGPWGRRAHGLVLVALAYRRFPPEHPGL